MPRFGPSFRHLRLPTINWSAFVGDKYKPNEEGEQIVGALSTIMMWKTFLAVDNSTDDAGDTGLSLDAFDVTSRADSAKIRLINNSGSTTYINGCVIRGKPVLRYSGDHGRVHDSLIDYPDIIRNGEKKYEFGNNYVCLRSQLESLADWHWKNLRTKRHIFSVEIPGRCYWYSPGEWYTLDISDIKGAEDINVLCECLQVQVESRTGELGRTAIVFREVYESWVHDINAASHFLSSGDPVEALNFDRVKIASSTYLDAADFYCDGTADEVQINAAINSLTGLGGGIVELTEGTFVTAAAIAPIDNIGIVGSGWNTVIEKDGAYDGISLVGGSGTEHANVVLSNFKITKDAGDSEGNYLMLFDYVDNLVLDHICADGGIRDGGYITNCDNLTVSDCSFINAGAGYNGLSVLNAIGVISSAKIVNNLFKTNGEAGAAFNNLEHAVISGNIAEGNTSYGFSINIVNLSSISNNIAADNGAGGVLEGGFILAGTGSNNLFSGNLAENNNKTGIYVVNAANTRNVFSGNRSTGNTVANWIDNGTNTTFANLNDFN